MEMKILDILFVDHSEDDVVHIQHVLEEGGLQLNPQRVDKIDTLHDALCHRHWDIILSDYSLPELSVQDVMAAMFSHQLDIPFIVVSSKVGEEAAVPLMAKGAHDFIMKANLSRLVPAIQRSLREVENFSVWIVYRLHYRRVKRAFERLLRICQVLCFSSYKLRRAMSAFHM